MAASSVEPTRTALLVGSTGAVGKPLLRQLLDSPRYVAVHSATRRPTGVQHPKLVEHTVDFDRLLAELADGAQPGPEAARLSGARADDVYITLGTTRAQAGSAAAFERIDREYVLAAARAARVTDVAPQRVVYCSAQMADSRARFLYPKSKGLTEEGLAAIGYDECLLFRPGFLAEAQREKKRALEEVYGFITGKILSRVTDSAEIRVSDLARAMIHAAALGGAGLTSEGVGNAPSDSFKRADAGSPLVTVVSNAEALRLVKHLDKQPQQQ